MVNIASGYNRRGHRALYDGNYAKAVECFYKAYLAEENYENVQDLIYALNQNADYIRALEFCYALLGIGKTDDRGMLYFLCAEAFGGAGSIEGCAQMLINSLETEPNGRASEDARAFLKDLVQKYGVSDKGKFSEELSIGESNGITEAPFLTAESYKCIEDISELSSKGDIERSLRRAEKEIEDGGITVAVLNAGIMLAHLTGERERMRKFAEAFRFVEDYTVIELRTLAFDLDELNDDEIAYTVYKGLYGKESGEKDIAYGFAVACKNKGEEVYAREIMNEVSSSAGGIGPASYALNKEGKLPYVMRFMPEEEKKFNDIIYGEDAFPNDPNLFENMLEYVRYADMKTAVLFVEKTDTEEFRQDFALRRLAVAPDVSLFLRAVAAKKLGEKDKKVFLNTGGDIILYTPAVGSVITRFFERDIKG